MRVTSRGKTISYAKHYLECGGRQTPLWLPDPIRSRNFHNTIFRDKLNDPLMAIA